ncbi:MAG: DUF4827 family protein [Massilibacteroides sp.]|nr:DUF4827 family protein [Massilibacteroides sp.]MDD3063560.1 DUF4827 family protein [Massilibacteroides sp.]MDD4114232.1 DUF4827 family protein [Massilibacteroides sp.]MDD4661051.1 DUF4827 family protein [Massilibacteroides sp.]
MKKGFNIVLMILGVVLFVSSCGNSKRTYTEMLKDERKMIRKLMDRENIVLLDKYPENGVFKENEFFQLSSGLYISVIDSGNGNRAVSGSTNLLCRFEMEYMDVLNDTAYYVDGFANDLYPMMFTYGASSASGSFYTYFGKGVVEPLQYIGDSAYVKLIVPFKIGGESQQSGGDPIYYKKLRYVFEK